MINISTGLRVGLLNIYGLSAYLNYGVFELYTGTQPNSADYAPTGTLLGRITNNGASFVEGDISTGCKLQQDVSGALRDDGNWILKVSTGGTVGWWRWRWYLADPGITSSYYPRIDGSYGEGLVLSSSSVANNSTLNISFYLDLIGDPT